MEKAENESAFSPLGVQICPCQNYQDFLFKRELQPVLADKAEARRG